ncbi:MAG TPA: potassium channel protein [Isosphaeraceae bacterium]
MDDSKPRRTRVRVHLPGASGGPPSTVLGWSLPDLGLRADPGFWTRAPIRRIQQGLLALVAVIAFGVVGYVGLGWDAFDALYMVVITVSGVGFGEVRLPSTTGDRIHTLLVIAFGVVAMAYTITGFLQLVTEGEIQRLLGHQRTRRQMETLTDHVIIVGFGRMGTLISEELVAAGVPFLIIERSAERLAEIQRRGYLGFVGDATEEKVLQDAGLERARALVTVVPSDADTVFITLTARQMVPGVQIVARAELPSTQRKLMQAGANHVILPAAIGAHRIASLLINPGVVEFVELVTHRSSLAIEMDEIPIGPGSSLAGRTLRDANIGRRTGVMVVAVKRADGRVEFPPTGDEPFAAGDGIVLLGRRSNLDQFRAEFQT